MGNALDVTYISKETTVMKTGYDQDGSLLYEKVEYRFPAQNDESIIKKCKVTDKFVSFSSCFSSLCFIRKADSESLTTLMTFLKNKNYTALQTVTEIFMSEEMKDVRPSTSDCVGRCYLIMMERASDEVATKHGWENWKKARAMIMSCQAYQITESATIL